MNENDLEQKTAEVETSQNVDIEQFFEDNQDKLKSFISTLMGEQMNEDGETSEAENKLKELEEKEKLLNNRQLEQDTIKLLSDYDIPANIAKLVMGSSLEDTTQNIEIFKKEFDKAVQENVIKRLAGKTPPTGNYSNVAKSIESTTKTIKDIIRRY